MNQEVDNKKTSECKDDTLDDIDTIFYDKLVTLKCSDGKNLTLSKHRLDIFGFYNKIFVDEPELKEIDCIHTSKEMISLLKYCYDDYDDILEPNGISLLSRLMHYYDDEDNDDRSNLIKEPKDITLLHPGSEDYFKREISAIFANMSWDPWIISTNECEFSTKTKAILYEAVITDKKKQLHFA